MDITTLATAIIGAVAPYLAKGGEKLAERFGDKAAQVGFEQRGKIWQLIKDLFAEDELTLLHLFAEHPEDASTQGKLESKLEDGLPDRPEVIGSLVELVKQIQELERNTSVPKNESNIENKMITNSVVINEVNQS